MNFLAYIYRILLCGHLNVIIMRTSCILYYFSVFLAVYNRIYMIIMCGHPNKKITIYIYVL